MRWHWWSRKVDDFLVPFVGEFVSRRRIEFWAVFGDWKAEVGELFVVAVVEWLCGVIWK